MIKFGDTKILEEMKLKRKKDPETARITIDLKMLMKIGYEKHQALSVIEKLLKLKK